MDTGVIYTALIVSVVKPITATYTVVIYIAVINTALVATVVKPIRITVIPTVQISTTVVIIHTALIATVTKRITAPPYVEMFTTVMATIVILTMLCLL